MCMYIHVHMHSSHMATHTYREVYTAMHTHMHKGRERAGKEEGRQTRKRKGTIRTSSVGHLLGNTSHKGKKREQRGSSTRWQGGW